MIEAYKWRAVGALNGQDVERRPDELFGCMVCLKHAVRTPRATWANSFVCQCGAEYRKVLPEASQADLNHLFGIAMPDYPEAGTF